MSGGDYVGGLCGYSYYGDIIACYNAADVSGANYVGGLCGFNAGGYIRSCYNTGNVSGNDYVGGVCGGANPGRMSACYNIGIVSSSGYAGGVCGIVMGSITACYWQYNTNGDAVLGIGKNGYSTVGTDAGTEIFAGTTLPVNDTNWVIGDGTTGQWKSLGYWYSDFAFEYPKLWWE
ncbi:MAG: hypothetical protein LBU62_12200 [Bacteroidales bacterium]|nr:hypothetical protein [Bacteroidales bacterium]